MNTFSIIFIFLYISHVLLGPYYYRHKLDTWNIELNNDTLKKCLYLTNICFLSLLFLNEYPTNDNLNVVSILIFSSLFGYFYFMILKHNKSPKYLIDHFILLVIPFIYLIYIHNLKFTLKLSRNVICVLIFVLLYIQVYQSIYF